MKMNKKLFAFGAALLIAVGALTTVSASYVIADKYQTVTAVDIPGWGAAKYNTTLGSKKSNSILIATFKKVKSEAALGNYVYLTTSGKSKVSTSVGLYTTSQWVSENSSVKSGTVYYSAIKSSALEPSNTCDATYKFSANKLN